MHSLASRHVGTLGLLDIDGNIEVSKLDWLVGRSVGSGRVGSCRKYYHFVAPSCKLELARFSAWLRIQDGTECGKKIF